jgi:hypothetical protein
LAFVCCDDVIIEHGDLVNLSALQGAAPKVLVFEGLDGKKCVMRRLFKRL